MTAPIPPTAGQIRTTASPSPSFDAVLTESERDQADARAATAEAERDEARDERDELNQKIHAMRAALGYLPTADPIQCAIQTAEALAEARQRIDALDAEATRWKTRLVHETDRLREQLDRANTGRQRLQEQISAQDQLLFDVVVTLQDWLHDTTADGTPIESLLNRLRHGFQRHAVRPGSSRHAQDAHVIRAVWNALCDALVRFGYVERPNLPGLPLAAAFTEALAALGYGVAGSSRPAQEDPSVPPPGWGYMARVDQLMQRVRPLIADSVPVVSFAELAEAADRVDAERAKLTPAGVGAAQGWDPTTPQWAVIRAAIAWRRMRADTPTTPKPEAAALIAAVDALPHTGEPRADLPTYGDDAPGTLRSRP